MKGLMIFVFMFFASSLMANDELDLKLQKLLYPSVRVLNGQGGGSGTVIYSDDRDKEGEFLTCVLTNHHVVDNLIHITRKWDNLTQSWYDVEDNDLATVELFSYANGGRTVTESPVKAEVLAYNSDEDLAVLMLKYPFKVDSIAKLIPDGNSLKLFQEVYIVGCPLLIDPVFSKGEINDLEFIIEKKEYISTTAPIIYGNSGGSVMVKTGDEYFLAGIPSRVSVVYSQAVSHMGYAIRPERIHNFILDNKLDFLLKEDSTPSKCFAEREKIRNHKRNGNSNENDSRNF